MRRLKKSCLMVWCLFICMPGVLAAEVSANAGRVLQIPGTFPANKPGATSTQAPARPVPSAVPAAKEKMPMKDALILRKVFMPSLCVSIPQRVAAIEQSKNEAQVAMTAAGISVGLNVPMGKLKSYFLASIEKSCCSPEKSFSVQEQQEAGCTASDTVAKCMDKLTTNCIREKAANYKIKDEMGKGSGFIAAGEKIRHTGQQMKNLQGILP